LCFLQAYTDLVQKVNDSRYWKSWPTSGAVLFYWTVIPYRTEWRYGSISPKLIVQDCGHLCQNLYLASEAIGAGTCAINAYDQDKTDFFVRISTLPVKPSEPEPAPSMHTIKIKPIFYWMWMVRKNSPFVSLPSERSSEFAIWVSCKTYCGSPASSFDRSLNG